MDSGYQTNPSSTKQESANPVGAYAKLVLQQKYIVVPLWRDYYIMGSNQTTLILFSWEPATTN